MAVSRRPRSATIESPWQAAHELRRAATEAHRAGRVSRRDLLRYLAALGLSGAGGAAAHAQTPPGRAGATVRIASLTPTGSVDPLQLSDPAGIGLVCQTCEYLIEDDAEALRLRPSLALAWHPDATGRIWTFHLRPGVRFHDGTPMRARDVVAAFDRLTDPASGSAGLSVMKGVLSKGGTRARDDLTVIFELDAPNGNFPYYVSSDNYNAAILPAHAHADFERHFTGTGPFRLERYTPKVGASFVRNPDYWNAPVLPARVEFLFYADQQAQMLALRGGDAHAMVDFTALNGRGLLHDPRYRVQRVRSSSHRQLHMRTDRGPFADARVRRALALAIDRQAIVDGMFLGRAEAGADHPFASVFPATPAGLPPRHRDLDTARRLLAEAGHARGLAATLSTETYMELPDYAVLIQDAAKSIGIDLTLRVETQAAYYGSASYGQSDWLDAPLGLTDYGHRGVPNLFLDAPLTSGGAWNGAHFRNSHYDDLVRRFAAALPLEAQQSLTREIVALLQVETPLIIGYFYDGLALMRSELRGFAFTALSHVWLRQAWLAAPGRV